MVFKHQFFYKQQVKFHYHCEYEKTVSRISSITDWKDFLQDLNKN